MSSSLFSNGNTQANQVPIQNQSVPNNIQMIKQMAQMVKSSRNPQMMLYNLLSQNPRTNQLLNTFGGDPKTAFYNLAMQKGIDPEKFISTIKDNF